MPAKMSWGRGDVLSATGTCEAGTGVEAEVEAERTSGTSCSMEGAPDMWAVGEGVRMGRRVGVGAGVDVGRGEAVGGGVGWEVGTGVGVGEEVGVGVGPVMDMVRAFDHTAELVGEE